MRLVVSGTLDNSTNTLYVTSSPQVTGQSSSKDFVDSGGVKNMASITFFLNMCGNQNPIDKPVSQPRHLCPACHVCCVVQTRCVFSGPVLRLHESAASLVLMQCHRHSSAGG